MSNANYESGFYKDFAERNDPWPSRTDSWVSSRISEGVVEKEVIQTAIARYSLVIQDGLATLQNVLDADEFALLLDVNPQPVWPIDSSVDLATAVLDGWGVSQDECPPGKLALLKLLDSLSLGQRLALVDVLERFWRQKTGGQGVDGVAASLGLQLRGTLST